ncbi:MAG: hypothetical protein K9K66_03695 [Desulfarculaceae bacterium]|nr:hypothetical protein [Desulfarculaceae bacterium]MCF8072963.1 hypothetical protein [Desulfarculaceae bacterium]MCF8100741.1 hypothetical protein [Desulfarculaceae bacterium]MCF8115479.1 hypothetical protein [Desulfarculaceae bacterium]
MARMIFRMSLVLAALVLVAACSGGGGGGSITTAKSGDWVDANNDGIYDPYQDVALWNQMNTVVTSSASSWLGPRAAWAAQTRAWRGKGNPAPSWRDGNGDGICDYAQDPNLWSRANSASWVDNNGDGVCDNYPNNSQWGGGWR